MESGSHTQVSFCVKDMVLLFLRAFRSMISISLISARKHVPNVLFPMLPRCTQLESSLSFLKTKTKALPIAPDSWEDLA